MSNILAIASVREKGVQNAHKAQPDFVLPMEAVGDARFRDAIKVPGTSFSVLRTEAVSDAKVKGATSLLLAVPISALVTVEGDGARCLDAISQRSQGPDSVLNMAEERSASMGIVRRLRGGGHFIVQRMAVASGAS